MASNPTFEGENSYEVIRDDNDKDKSHEYAGLPDRGQTGLADRGRTGGHAAYSKSFITCLLLINLVVLAIGFGIGFGVAYGVFRPTADQGQYAGKCTSNPCATGAVCSDGVDGYRCTCDGTVTHRDCKEVRTMCSVSGVYTVTPSGGTPTQVYCDMDTSGGGWLVFQNRVNGSVDFYLNWTSYAAGFGDLNGEFWLGNRNLHLLTAQNNYTLRVVLGDWERNQTYAQYNSFTVGSERHKFRLTVGGYSGTAGDSLGYSSGSQFSTRDSDNDEYSRHCAQWLRGAWWYGGCSRSSLNGRYYPAGPYTSAQSQTRWQDGVWWRYWKGDWYSLKSTTMMIRPAP